MSPRAIRVKAVCVCHRGGGGAVLLGDGVDPATRLEFRSPPGGGVEFGERAVDAMRREMREELGVEVAGVALLGVLENVFTFDGETGHEVVFVYEARLADPALEARDELHGFESNHVPLVTRWIPLAELARGDGPPVYPDGLVELLLRRFPPPPAAPR